MSNQEELLVRTISIENQQAGYGRFPYVILRINSAIYMQFPIHFILENQEKETLEGLRIAVDKIEDSNMEESLIDPQTQ